MDVEAAKMIGAGIAVIALLGVGVGIGNIFSTFVASVARNPVSYTHLRAHETKANLVCRLLLEKKNLC